MSNTSLLQYFEPPTEFIGYFGLVCGYDATAGCVRNMVGRFCNLAGARWSPQGYQPLVFMVDASSDFHSCADDGWLRLPLKNNAQTPYKILHAKVALLAFQSIRDPAHWRIRLLVSTGNWTEQTVLSSLDLMWSVEVDSTSLDDATACADIKAAWKMLRWLSTLHNTSILEYTKDTPRISVNAERWENFGLWLDQVGKNTEEQPRFFDNTEKSLLAQLPAQVSEHARGVRRNYLAMGSGFFEKYNEDAESPDVLQKIVNALQGTGRLLKNVEIEIIVNERSCQGIAQYKDKISEKNWTISRPTHALEPYRTLHAKFLFSAYDDGKEPRFCKNPWVYLGSGNLTHPGFANPMSPSGGNLEAGVVFNPGETTWYPHKDYECISEYLPIAWPSPPTNLNSLESGSDFPDKGAAFPIPPVSFVLWEAQGLRLPAQEEPSVPCQILAPDENPCAEHEGLFVWPSSRPSKVVITWNENGKPMAATVPVMDEFGNVGATPTPPHSIAEALDRLGDFPLPTDSDTPENEEEDGLSPGSGGGGGHAAPAAAPHPVRTIMTLVERIAEKQTSLTETEWTRWCMQLEQTLTAMKDNDEVASIVAQLGINPLHALYADPFRPSFAEDAKTEAGKLYERTIAAIESAWGLKGKQALGVKA